MIDYLANPEIQSVGRNQTSLRNNKSRSRLNVEPQTYQAEKNVLLDMMARAKVIEALIYNRAFKFAVKRRIES